MSKFFTSVDLVLACIIVAQFVLARNILARVDKRDAGFSERFERWRLALDEVARQRQDPQRPSPAE